jgi:hypothetical protein
VKGAAGRVKSDVKVRGPADRLGDAPAVGRASRRMTLGMHHRMPPALFIPFSVRVIRPGDETQASA